MSNRYPIKFEDDEKEILNRFYNRLRETLTKAYGYGEAEADFEAYKWILKNTTKPPKDYLSIFYALPEEAQKKVLGHLGYKTAIAFKKNFSKQLNIYRQSTFRRENKNEEVEEIEGEENGFGH